MEELLAAALIYGLSHVGSKLVAWYSNKRIDAESDDMKHLRSNAVAVLGIRDDTEVARSANTG